MHFQSAAGSALSGLSSSSRDATMDPIAELLSQLSSVRNRAAAAQSVSSQLQQLEMQLQSTRQQLERLPRRQAEAASKPQPGTANSNAATSAQVVSQAATLVDIAGVSMSRSSSNVNLQFLLARCGDEELSESERQTADIERADRSVFVQELLLSTLAEGLRLDDEEKSGYSSSGQSGAELDTEHVGVGPGGLVLAIDHVSNLGRNSSNDKTAVRHRNMVNHLEATKNSEKEPPPSVAKH